MKNSRGTVEVTELANREKESETMPESLFHFIGIHFDQSRYLRDRIAEDDLPLKAELLVVGVEVDQNWDHN